MRCDLHCPHPGGGNLLGVLAFAAVFVGAVFAVVHVLLDPAANAVADVVVQATVGVAAAGVSSWLGWMAARGLYEHLRSPGERRKYEAAWAAQRQAAVTARRDRLALPAVPTYRPTDLPTSNVTERVTRA